MTQEKRPYLDIANVNTHADAVMREAGLTRTTLYGPSSDDDQDIRMRCLELVCEHNVAQGVDALISDAQALADWVLSGDVDL